MKYIDKLKDPRWQRKRLEILQRDDFACHSCGDKNNTLHVHHKIYYKGIEPWDYESHILITLCADCHKREHGESSIFADGIKELLQEHLLNEDISELYNNLYCMKEDSFDELFSIIKDFAVKNALIMGDEKNNE